MQLQKLDLFMYVFSSHDINVRCMKLKYVCVWFWYEFKCMALSLALIWTVDLELVAHRFFRSVIPYFSTSNPIVLSFWAYVVGTVSPDIQPLPDLRRAILSNQTNQMFFFLECEFQEEQHWEIKAVNLYLWHPWRDEKNKRYVVGVLLPQQVKHGWKGKSKVYSRFWSHFTAETVSYVSTPAGI